MKQDLLHGPNSVEAALAHDPSRLIEVLIEAGTRNPRVLELGELAAAQGVSVLQRPRRVLDQASGGARHQGIVARARKAPTLDENALLELVEQAGSRALLLVLDGVTDPHNLGACLRSAEGAGATVVIAPKDRAVGLTPIAHRASAGAADRIPFVQVTNLARCLKQLQQAGVWIIGAAGDEDSLPLWEVDMSGPVALVMGSEGDGLRRLTREHCDHLARIPMPGEVESLNVSVAAGIFLFEACRQRST